MNRYLITAPRSVLALIYGVPFGAFMAAFGLTQNQHHRVLPALVGGVIAGVCFGVLASSWADRKRARSLLATGSTDQAVQVGAARALIGGELPQDVAVRRAARTLAQDRLARLRATGRTDLLFFVLAISIYVGVALTVSPWWWFGAVVFASALVRRQRAQRHLARRLALLEQPPSTAADDGAPSRAR